MAIYLPELADKIKDTIAGLKKNWEAFLAHVAAFEAHKADFEAHQAESASKHITESGSNDNGHYIKFDDGTMICYRQGTLTIPTMMHQPNGLWRVHNAGDFYFPETFSAVPFAEMKLQAGEEINCSPRGLSSSYYNAGITSLSDLSGQTRSYYLFAIGRWK